MPQDNRPLVLITGASSGIGKEFAMQYARRGADLVLIARRGDRLEELAAALREGHGIRAHAIEQDLAEAGAVDKIMAALEGLKLTPGTIVNNAGYSIPTGFADTPWPIQSQLLQVLLATPLELVSRCLPRMIQQGGGQIINVASLAGFGPGLHTDTLYTPLKSALIKFSQAINIESRVKDWGVRATALCPGYVMTEFHDANGTRELAAGIPGYLWLPADRVVKAGIDAVERGQAICIPGKRNRLIAFMLHMLPGSLVQRLFAGQHQKASA